MTYRFYFCFYFHNMEHDFSKYFLGLVVDFLFHIINALIALVAAQVLKPTSARPKPEDAIQR